MKKFTILFGLILTLIACDAPQQVRYDGIGGYSQDSMGSYFDSTTGTSSDEVGTNVGNMEFNTTQEQGLGAGFSNCSLNVTHYTSDVGYFAVCQSSTNNDQIALKFQETDFTQGSCVVPLNRDASGTTVYLGSAQCTYHNANQVLQATLVKNRVGYETKPVNSLMIMKRSTLSSFFGCMDAVPNFLYNNIQCRACPANCSSQTWTQCLSAAQADMSRLCGYFESNANYIQVNF